MKKYENAFARSAMSCRAAIAVSLFSAMLSIGTVAVAGEYSDRSGGTSSSAMLARSNPTPAEGLGFFRPVLAGVLYRAGFKGGDKGRTGLSSSQRQELCDAGFSSARYIDFGKNTKYGTTNCSQGAFEYSAGRSTKPSDIMREIHEVIENPDRGPVLVHCMWGVHSSGAISAMALVQFCGWSEDRAKKYWDEARNGADCSGGCSSWIDKHFETFKFDPALAIGAAEQAAICPK